MSAAMIALGGVLKFWSGQWLQMLRRALTGLMLLLVRAYQLTISPMLGPRCRFYPSCSEYCSIALRRHGPLAGLWLGLHRVFRCHPWGGSGHDPVPETFALRLGAISARRWPDTQRRPQSPATPLQSD